MKIEGFHPSMSAPSLSGAGMKEAALQNQIQALQRELNRLDQKEELSKEEKQQKQELEKQLSELKQELQKVKREEMKEQQVNQKRNEQEEDSDTGAKEEGKGEYVDEHI